MATIVTLAHQKGGVGKATLALNLCACFEQVAGHKAAVIDADVQGSITELIRTMQKVEDWQGVTLLTPPHDYAALKARTDHSLFVVDTPPYLSDQLPTIFDHSDLVLVPCKASVFDALAIGGTLKLVKEAQDRRRQQGRPQLLAAIVINMVRNNKFVGEILDTLEAHQTHILRTKIKTRVIYERGPLLYGSVVTEKARLDDPKAYEEMVELALEVTEFLHTGGVV